jgi:hypothetical protein
LDGQDSAVLDVMAQMQSYPSPPVIQRNRSEQQFVQPPSVRKVLSGHRFRHLRSSPHLGNLQFLTGVILSAARNEKSAESRLARRTI